ncbi:hypothetical protein H310_07095 [Aphanomyces invadans]|uniref:Uncharacterized protein n=1 Tax=Aphanomyces invadans TaxID=157072 RepID=A0A024U4F7_9STRA|nr:hypothetical protein H310_07095 [Aphanomyces invadans]ETW00478.1 hypothetical protein H310_07095 [Aphanomyces invadans]|eukprot:XP_008870613.1 hypothetical protein H310_07095 [Aphanomyces invadans]
MLTHSPVPMSSTFGKIGCARKNPIDRCHCDILQMFRPVCRPQPRRELANPRRPGHAREAGPQVTGDHVPYVDAFLDEHSRRSQLPRPIRHPPRQLPQRRVQKMPKVLTLFALHPTDVKPIQAPMEA